MGIKTAIYEYAVHSGSILALGASGMAFTASILYGVFPPIELLLVMYLITFASYNINRYSDLSSEDLINHPTRRKFYIRNAKGMILVSVLAVIIAFVITYFKAGAATTLLLTIPPVSVTIYSVKWIPLKSVGRIKEIFLIKNIWSSLIWALIAVITALFVSAPINIAVFSVALFIFLRFFINCVVFDMRDITGDKSFDIRTLPIAFGSISTRNLLLLVNTVSGIFIIAVAFWEWLPKEAYALSLITFYGYYFIMKTTKEKTDMNFLCDVVVDGEFIFWAPLALIGSLFF